MARAGEKIKLECEVKGNPEPQLTWMHNGKPVKETRDVKVNITLNLINNNQWLTGGTKTAKLFNGQPKNQSAS